jgi:hypothetical protein
MGGLIMSSTINADTTNGVVVTSDTSGEIKLQSAGADIATVSSAGIAMASGKTLTGDAVLNGKILQTVEFTNNSQVIVNTTVVAPSTPYDTFTKATITPSSTSSKILIFVQQSWFQSATTSSQGMGFRVQRGSTYITTPATFTASYQGVATRSHAYTPIIAYDSPNTTSSVTYTVMGYHHTANGEVRMQYGSSQSSSSIILMEVAG